MSINTYRQKYKDLSSIKTDQSRALLLREIMTLPYSITGVTNPLENHSCSMIFPHRSISVITTDIARFVLCAKQRLRCCYRLSVDLVPTTVGTCEC